ncbi:hypothetical protein KC19_11G067500 [Ceratodon purpureus]|uniref:Uncharacterized protein n=1 Tax=Ceratodon purpureus TaxID=3225 RepID=A0A8T0GEQ7_CERPU|nr:hypothetical protein KC19_11G067500 [Ceratodon purpureus]
MAPKKPPQGVNKGPTQSQIDDIVMNIMQARPNMLDATLEAAALKRGPSISRMLYAARIPEDKHPEPDKTRIASWHELTLKQVGMLLRMSGFLIVYPTCVLHLLEAVVGTGVAGSKG